MHNLKKHAFKVLLALSSHMNQTNDQQTKGNDFALLPH